VIDGFLIPNDTTEIKLSRTNPIYSSEGFEPETNALVEIEANDGTRYQLTEKISGTYVMPPLNLDPAREYRLHVRTGDTEEYASEFVGIKNTHQIDSVTFQEIAEGDALEFYVYSHDPEGKTRYYLWTYDETFEYVSGGPSRYYHENGQVIARKLATELYNCWKTNETNDTYITSTSQLSEDIVYDFPLYKVPQLSLKLYFAYSVLVKQIALTEGAYAYWSSIKTNSEELGSLSDPIPAQPFTNITCLTNPSVPVIGYFTASTLVTKRLFLTRQQIKGPSTPYEETGYEDCEVELILLEDISEENLRGKLIYDREYDLITQEFLGYIVLSEYCLDCRKRGGVNVKPDFWK
ncbi:MAG TPA: DUF4249 domain-containing protein, partial [Chryseolinea sp.]|nr:DUF4249 domain-containing protein [Chryseolinea sp.]